MVLFDKIHESREIIFETHEFRKIEFETHEKKLTLAIASAMSFEFLDVIFGGKVLEIDTYEPPNFIW